MPDHFKPFNNVKEAFQITVPEGASKALMKDIGAASIVGIIFPDEMDGDKISFDVVTDESEYDAKPLVDKTGTEITVPVAAGKAINVPAEITMAWSNVVIRTGTLAAPVVQTAARTLIVIVRNI